MSLNLSPEYRKELLQMSAESRVVFDRVLSQFTGDPEDLMMIYLAGWIRGKRDDTKVNTKVISH